MQLKTLTIDNFCCYGHTELNFDDFSTAIIIGQQCGNLKISNGAGKSTIFAAIRYVLFNQTDYTHFEKIIRNGTDACKVATTFIASDNETYRIVRSRHRKTGADVRLFRGQEDLTSRTNSQTEKDIEKLLKINYKTFCNSVLFAQQDFSGLASLTPTDRKKLLRETLALGIYAKYEAEAKLRAADLTKNLDKTKTILSTLGTPQDDISKWKQELSSIEKTLASSTSFLQWLKTDFDTRSAEHLTLQKDLEATERQSLEFSGKQKTLESEISSALATVKDYERKIGSIREAGSRLAADAKTITNDIKQLETITLRGKDDIKIDIDTITKLVIDKKALLGSFSAKVAELQIPIPEGGKCKHCRRVISDEDRTNCQNAIVQEMAEIATKTKSTQQELKTLQSQKDTLQAELEKANAHETSLSNKRMFLTTKQKELEGKKSVFVEFNTLAEKAKLVHAQKDEELRALLQNKPEDNSVAINKLKLSLNQVKTELKTLQSTIDDTNKSIMTLTNSKAVLLHKIEERAKDIVKIEIQKAAISELERKYIIHQKVVNAFGSKGIPTMITHSVLDDLQFQTNAFLTKLKPDLQARFVIEKEKSDGDMGDTLDIVFQLGANDFEFAQLSGAQKMIASFALRLGLAETIKKRLGIKINLLLIDEVDQALDEANIETFAGVIKKIAEEYKLVVISHNNELKDRFHKGILVEQNAELVSTAKVVNAW
jgi:DNA repair exonuclease SbcCD ATPase subunit